MIALTPPHLGGHCFVCHLDEGCLLEARNTCGCESILDIGCGLGCQLTAALRVGFRDALGIEGDPAAIAAGIKKGVAVELFREHDLTKAGCLVGQFDLLWSVEFLEHLDERFLPNFWFTVAQCRPKLTIITVAPPEMAGGRHVNCQNSDYWRGAFAAHGYRFDADLTSKMRRSSTMKREFVRKRGMAFIPFE